MDDRITTTDGLNLRVRTDNPPGPPLARIVLIHGIGDHVDGLPYTTAASALAARGFAVHRMELRGHGRSDGPRVYVNSFADYRADLRQFVRQVGAGTPARSLHLVGISLGGLIVTSYALHHPDGLAGVVAVAPALGEVGGSPLMRALLPLLSRLAPRLPIDPKLDLSHLTRDRELQKAYVEDDPLYQTRITPRVAAELLSAIAVTRTGAPRFRTPLLVLHGAADTVTSPQGSREFFDRAGSADKSYKTYAGAYHNLFVETNREEVFDDIAAWVRARASSAPGR